MDGYQVVFEHKVLFRDLDAMGHVNNVAFMAFMEDARMQYWKALRKEYGLKTINFILAEITCSYQSPAYLGETLLIGIRACKLGNKSFHFEYRMEDKGSGRLVTEGRSVQVMYDYKQQHSVPLGEEFCKVVASLEQLELAALSSG
ncbi:MAG: acyl-CoA thioesterase [Deltaproteobacteria bacterium]|nr:MAG: acyl-CoA thioesterase [Deltaproteobacteria bacterium]